MFLSFGGALVALVLAAADDSPASSSVNIQGDADCSQSVGVDDAVAVLERAASLTEGVPCESTANVNCDGAIDAHDALEILKFAAGLSTDSPDYCDDVGDPLGPVTVAVDAAVQPLEDTVPGLDGGPPRPLGASMGPDGGLSEFVGNEVVYRPENETALQEFLDEHGGVVLRDGVTNTPPTDTGSSSPPVEHGYYLIRVDPSLAPVDQIADDLADAGLVGSARFSSEDAIEIAALVMGESELGVSLNIVGRPGVSNEHPMNAMGTQWLDAEQATWNTDTTPGLSVGTARAWDYLKYHQVPPDNGPFTHVRVAVIDTGFALHQVTGAPLNGNLDYRYFGTAPLQWDEAGDDSRAGGEALMQCSGGSTCPWHGTGSFGVCCAKPHNNYGTAGSGWDVVFPVLINVDSSFYTWGDAIRHAGLMNAGVITMSFSGDCGFWCDVSTADGNMEDAVEFAIDRGSIVLAAAGNAGNDISDNEILPCKITGVICVGGVHSTTLENSYNFGDGVDIWAPYSILSTVTPLTAEQRGQPTGQPGDNDDWGQDELYSFSGTSSATPFTAGIVALMRALDPNISVNTVLSILQNTSNPGANAEVAHGYVDALRAVLAVRENQPPSINIVQPVADSTHSYANLQMRAEISDPEPGALLPKFNGLTSVTFSTDAGGFACFTNTVTYRNQIPGYECSAFVPLGTKAISAVVTDPFGAQAGDEVPVNVVNSAPIVDVLEPGDGATYYATQSIDFGAYVFDAEESIPFPQDRIVWTSDIAGQIGTGSTFSTTLPQGTHVITVTATDTIGVSTQDSFTLNILSGAGLPVVDILSPTDNSTFYWGYLPGQSQEITFIGQASDPEDGELSGDSLDWYSDIDGYLGSGNQFTRTLTANLSCPNNTFQPHVITLVATDSDNHQVNDAVDISIVALC